MTRAPGHEAGNDGDHQPRRTPLPGTVTTGTGALTEAWVDAHLASVYAMARGILGDEELARAATVGSFRDAARAPGRCECPTRRQLAAHLVDHCRTIWSEGPPSDATGRGTELHERASERAARDVRIVLSLVIHGGLTATQAARSAQMPEGFVLELLCEGRRIVEQGR